MLTSAAHRQVTVRVVVSGTVQGVGFRPFVYNLARQHGLRGFVRNIGGVVEIVLAGRQDAVETFLAVIKERAPQLAQIAGLEVTAADSEIEYPDFQICASAAQDLKQAMVPADTATCQDCLSELYDPGDRRYRYPFTNCTNCGPRFTIIGSLPYDRLSTTMAEFAMCANCRKEYEDPGNRRFHAQPNACDICGPCLSFLAATENTGKPITGNEAALDAALEYLRRGKIVAAKGLGGFHLMCDANNDEAIRLLRQRKHRYAKPLAVMMSDMAMVRRFCEVSDAEERLLCSAARPIVLLKKHPQAALSGQLAPGTHLLGVMLPYTPLHHLLLSDFGRPLVATSGNASQEPIVIACTEAREKLAEIADAFLLHNRAIKTRFDDSVMRVSVDSPMIYRRARGWAPLPVKLPFNSDKVALALGGQLKNTFCFIQGAQAFVSQHIGDLENLETLENFKSLLNTFKRLFHLQPDILACDLHPDYLSTGLAASISEQDGLPLYKVQHHHGHIVSCMVEHGINQPVIGVAFDGIGLGDDGCLWGGEFLLSSWKEYKRLGHLSYVPLAGATQAIRQPWRMLLAYEHAAAGQLDISALPSKANGADAQLVRQQIARGVNCPQTSSGGRLFDAVSAMLGICEESLYEGQAAIELEACAQSFKPAASSEHAANGRAYKFTVESSSGFYVVNPLEILQGVLADMRAGCLRPEIAWKFHFGLALMIVGVCRRIRQETKVTMVCLSGGVFQNELLLRLAREFLQQDGFSVYFPRQLPANDGGLSLGQATIALARGGIIHSISF